MGALDLDSHEEIEYLKGFSNPMINKYITSTIDNTLEVNFTLEQLEIRLIILAPK